MADYNTILSQITSLINRHDFDYHAEVHHSGQKFRSYNRWSQFMAMLTGQLSGRKSLRGITDNLKAQQPKPAHIRLINRRYTMVPSLTMGWKMFTNLLL